jgi:spore coat polysaccharide biosynthesis protein SpsF
VTVGVFLAARVGSRRLPRKVLLPLDGLTMLEAAMKALAAVEAGVYALLTDSASAPELRGLASACGFSLFEGPEEDVLARYCLAASAFGVGRIVRATGDNPLVSPAQTARLLCLHERGRFDLSHFLGPPLGTGVEVVEAAALYDAAERSADPYEREHLTTHLYRNRDRYRVYEAAAPPEWTYPEGSVTVDTEADYRRIRRLFEEQYRGEPLETEAVIAWLKGRPG